MDTLKVDENTEKGCSRKYFLATVLACNLSSFTVGIILTWTAPVLPKINNSDNLESNPFGEAVSSYQESWIGSCLSFGAIFGPVLAGFTTNTIGRKNTLLYCAGLPFLISLIIVSFAETVFLYYIARFIAGFGIGNFFTTLPMYFGEISEPSVRGTVASSMNVFIVLGELYSYSIGPFVSICAFSLSCAIISVSFLVIFYFFPESPYHSVAKGQTDVAESSLMKLRGQKVAGVQNELKAIQGSIEEEMTNKGTFLDIFKSRAQIKALVICTGLMVFQQFTGITVVLFFATNIFQASGSSFSPDLSSIIIGIVQLLASFSTPILVDRLGRKLLLIVSAVGVVISEVALGMYFCLKDSDVDVASIGWLPVVSLVGYIIAYNIGFGPLPWTLMGELFPSNIKSVASMTTTCVCWTWSFLLANLFATITLSIGIGGTFLLFSGCCLLAIVFIIVVVIETKGKSFQEIQNALCK